MKNAKSFFSCGFGLVWLGWSVGLLLKPSVSGRDGVNVFPDLNH